MLLDVKQPTDKHHSSENAVLKLDRTKEAVNSFKKKKKKKKKKHRQLWVVYQTVSGTASGLRCHELSREQSKNELNQIIAQVRWREGTQTA